MAELVAGKRRYYTDDEDNRILAYIKKVKRNASDENLGLQGRVIWMDMVKENILPGRSWKSLRNRYENYLKKIEVTTSDEEESEEEERKNEKIKEVQKLALVPRIEVNLLKPLEVAANEKRQAKSTLTEEKSTSSHESIFKTEEMLNMLRHTESPPCVFDIDSHVIIYLTEVESSTSALESFFNTEETLKVLKNTKLSPCEFDVEDNLAQKISECRVK